MKMKKLLSSALVLGLAVSIIPSTLMGAGEPSGYKTYKTKGQIGGVQMNPYRIAPLTAIILNGGYTLTDVNVTVEGKGDKGVPIKYEVADNKILQHGGIPVWGLYPDHVNKVNVSYKRSLAGEKAKEIKETYKLYAAPVSLLGKGVGQTSVLPKAKVVQKADKKVKDNLYLLNHLSGTFPGNSQVLWNYPNGGALSWDYESYVWIVDTNGDIRWYMKTDEIRDPDHLRKKGNMMGFDQTKDGGLIWGMGQAYLKYDLMGQKVFNRNLPKGYIDFSHHMEETSKGTYLLRVGSADYKRKDNKNIRSIRDVIIELDKDGNLLDEWKIMEILDPYRDNNLLAMDQGAVCLNLSEKGAGHTMTKEEMEGDALLADITGVGAGRNWAHINSVNYDKSDDSIILSIRNQSATVKITRDKKVKWILGSPEGWSKKFQDKLLTPVDAKGKKIVCEDEGSVCPGYTNEKGGFDWTWTQHTSYVVPEKSKPGALHVTVFDNGDSRGMEQPAMISDKYSRAVEYVVDEKNMTVKQIWEFGKERGFEWYSPITSVVEYQPKKDTLMVHSATAGLGDVKAFLSGKAELTPFLHEFDYKTKKSLFEMKFTDSAYVGYRALNIDLEGVFK